MVNWFKKTVSYVTKKFANLNINWKLKVICSLYKANPAKFYSNIESTETGKFHGLAQNSADNWKLLSLEISSITLSKVLHLICHGAFFVWYLRMTTINETLGILNMRPFVSDLCQPRLQLRPTYRRRLLETNNQHKQWNLTFPEKSHRILRKISGKK